jgi:hypothetical protein
MDAHSERPYRSANLYVSMLFMLYVITRMKAGPSPTMTPTIHECMHPPAGAVGHPWVNAAGRPINIFYTFHATNSYYINTH